MTAGDPQFYPFFDPRCDGETLSFTSKTVISIVLGGLYSLLHYYVLPDKLVFFEYNLWIIGAIISTSLLALYVAVEVFRRNLEVLCELQGDQPIVQQMIDGWLSDRAYGISGVVFALIVVASSISFGIPEEMRPDTLSLAVFIAGKLLAGFTAGMGMHGIVAVVVLYLKCAPELQYSLDLSRADAFSGIKKLGDSLWFFAGLISCVGVLVLMYLFSIPWTNVYRGPVQALLVFWAALPMIAAISVVLIPGLAVRRQITKYKSYMSGKLRSENAELYSSYKKFNEADDDEIIQEKKEIGERLQRIQEQMERLRKLRNSHIDD